MKTRLGKIARLPRLIREQLNERIQDGEAGPALLEWLNSLSDVREVLAREFEGKPINAPNLTAWRQGGYTDWVTQGEVLELSQRLEEEVWDIDVEEREIRKPLSVLLLKWLTARYMVASRQPLQGEEGWKRLRELCVDLARLRRMEDQERRLRMAEAKLEGDVLREYNSGRLFPLDRCSKAAREQARLLKERAAQASANGTGACRTGQLEEVPGGAKQPETSASVAGQATASEVIGGKAVEGSGEAIVAKVDEGELSQIKVLAQGEIKTGNPPESAAPEGENCPGPRGVQPSLRDGEAPGVRECVA